MTHPFRRPLLAALLSLTLPAFASVPNPSPQQDRQRQVQLPTSEQDRPRIEVAFVLDTTSSMGGLIEGAKQKIWSIASHIARGQPTPQLRVGLVAYRDRGDEYVAKKFELTRDLDSVYVNLKGLQAQGGGDTPEHVGRGLGEAVKSLEWSPDKNVMKLIFLVGDAPPHDYQDGWDYRTWAARAYEKGIVVNTVRCGSDAQTEVAWREISRLGHGTFTTIAEDGGMVAMATPYDDKLAKLNSEIASKTLYAGKAPARLEAKRKLETVAALPVPAAADRMEFLKTTASKGAGMAAAPAAPMGTRDLAADPSQVAKLEEDEVPESLKGLSKPEQQAKVEQLAKERSALETEAAKTAREREDWVAKHRSEKKDSFDAKVMEGVKNQAKQYGMTY